MMWLYALGAAAITATFLADLWLDIDYRVAANVSLFYMAALVTVFTVLYGWRSKWRANRGGEGVPATRPFSWSPDGLRRLVRNAGIFGHS